MNLENEVLTNIRTDDALNSILSNFSSDYIIHVVEDSLKMKFRPYYTAMPGLNSIEQYFQINMNSFPPEQRDQIIAVRYETYKEIIGIICRDYNITYIGDDSIDIYSAAYYLYNIFVADFTNTIINFFINYILQEQISIYSTLNLSESKKNKDSGINYSRKIYTNQRLGLIHANINQVLDDICTYDIQLQDIVYYSLKGDVNLINFINSIIIDNGNVFKTHFASYLSNSDTRADIITNIKLNLQKYSGSDDKIINSMITKNEEETSNE